MGMVIPLEGHLQICRGEERRGEEKRENYLPYCLTYLTERFASPDRQTDRRTDWSRLQKESGRERMRRSIPLQKECLPSIYIYLIDKRCKIYSTCTSYRKHSQFRPKLHVCLCWCVCVGVYCIYMCVSGPNKLHALTRGTHARTHICTHGSLSRSPTPVSCPREKKDSSIPR